MCGQSDPSAAVLVPAGFLDGVRRSLDGARSVEVTLRPGAISVDVDGERHDTTALGHDFPAYRALLPGPRDHRVPVDLPAVRAALADEPGRVARLAVEGEALVVGDPGPGGADLVLGVDPAFLLQALAAGGSDRLVLELDGPVSPLAIRPADDDGGFSLLMPVRLDA